MPAIGISTWSLAILALTHGVPVFLAGGVSACYDGGAIGAFYISLQWQRKYQSNGLSAQLAAILFAASSFYLNWNHGVLMGYPMAVRYLLAMPSVIALIILELWLRFLHRGTLRKPVPKPEFMAWVLFPFNSFKTLKHGYRVRLTQLRGETLPIAIGEVDTETIRTWLRERGYKPGFTGPISREHRAIYAAANNGGSDNNGKDN